MMDGMAMGGMGMSMGAPSMTAGAGMDSNNYLDVRKEQHNTDQGTIRVDRVFDRGDSVFARYSAGGENGFMPQNLPGFGANHDNLSQNGNISWTRIITPNVLNTASVAVSRLSMNRYSQNNGTNDIVSELGIQGVGFGGPGAYGAPYFNVQGYSGFGDSLPRRRCTPGTRFWRAAMR